jgi:hypothetical protein
MGWRCVGTRSAAAIAAGKTAFRAASHAADSKSGTLSMDWALKLINPKVISPGSGHHNNATTSEPSPASTHLLNLTGLITREDDYPFARGGSADVWKGTLLKGTGKRKVLPEFIFSLFVHVPT